MEVSVDTRMRRRDMSAYESRQISGVEILTLPEVAQHAVSLSIDLRAFLFFRSLRAALEFDNGLVVGRAYG